MRNYTFDLERSAAIPCARYFNNTAKLDTHALTRTYGGYALGDGKAGVSNLIWYAAYHRRPLYAQPALLRVCYVHSLTAAYCAHRR